MMNKEYELDDDMLDEVDGGHALSEHRYTRCGIKTHYHLLREDEFWLPDGTKTDETGANNYVISLVGQEKFDHWKKRHAHRHTPE